MTNTWIFITHDALVYAFPSASLSFDDALIDFGAWAPVPDEHLAAFAATLDRAACFPTWVDSE